MDAPTWNSLPPEKRPFPDRLNVVIGSADGLVLPEDVLHFDDLEDALYELGDRDDLDDLFVIGGEKLFAEAILHPDLEEIHLTRIEEDYQCDSFFPAEIPEEFKVASTSEIMESDALEYTFVILVRKEDDYEEYEEEDYN